MANEVNLLGREGHALDCSASVADVLGLDEADAKSLILGRQTWKMYKENNLKGRLPSYRELKRMGCAAGVRALPRGKQ